MTDTQELGLRKIRRALISVSDKTGIVDLAQQLKRFGVEIISTGGTANALRAAGIDVLDVSEVTGFPEMMDGRVKTLHPKIHGGLLGIRDNAEHQAAMEKHNIEPIDLVVINLYPFQETIAREGVTLEEAIEQIDIGGPAMIRSAAKNFSDVAVVSSTELYETVIEEMKRYGGALSLDTRQKFAGFAFTATFIYDANISTYLMEHAFSPEQTEKDHELSQSISLSLTKRIDLRYGENPHQTAALYSDQGAGVANAELLSGKEMSFNNYVDADAAWQLVSDFDERASAIIKHTNPAGVGLGASNKQAYRRALETDPLSAFGGIVAFNRKVDSVAAQAVVEIFTEVVVAPDYEEEALDVFKTKKNLRVLRIPSSGQDDRREYRQIGGGMLVQTRDTRRLKPADLKVVTKRQPAPEEIEAMLFAWTVCKHTKSNAIVYARAGQTVGVGAGQMSRLDSVKLGAMRAQIPVAGSVLASDAFFPFRDGIDEAAKHGITAVIQPGGSMRDAEVIAAADEYGLAMVFTGVRHFKH
jgi:phosphoribosylaminoimidazolecarboxamide formyltransferase/IMP cyclohydrolase